MNPDNKPEPAMLYAVKLGPIATAEGAVTLYCSFEENVAHPPVLADSDEDGLRRVAAQSSGARLQCDAALARAGKKLGFEPALAPEWVRAATLATLTSLALGPGGTQLGNPLVLYGLATAAARFYTAAPWTRWDDAQPMELTFSGAFKGRYEAAVFGKKERDVGLALYADKGAAAKVARLVAAGKPDKASKVDSLLMVLDDEPKFAVELFERMLGIAAIPVAAKLKGGRAQPVTEAEVLALAAALNAAAALHPRAREIVGDAGVAGYSKGVVRVRLVAPKPAGSEARAERTTKLRRKSK